MKFAIFARRPVPSRKEWRCDRPHGRNGKSGPVRALSGRHQARLEIATKISDNSMRDVSVGQIISLCVKVNHLKTATIPLARYSRKKPGRS